MTARFRQLNPYNYRSSAQVQAEFEHFARYLVAAERGNKTLAELMAILFDEEGEFAGPIELRLDTTQGLQFRVGTYDDAEAGWQNLTTIEAIRGPAGSNVGYIEGPLFFNRQDYSPANGDTALNYTFSEDASDTQVYINGALQPQTGVYTTDTGAGTVTFSSAFAGTETVSILSIRAQDVTNYRRADTVASENQAVFPFVHTADEILMVYRNGIYQRPGGAYDYTTNPDTDTVTFTSALAAGELVTIVTVENQALKGVAGLMLEDAYTDGAGYIALSKVSIADGGITQAKVENLPADLAARAKLTVSASTPTSASSGDLWLNTAVTPNVLQFFDGTSWWPTSPDNAVPTYGVPNAKQFLRINAAGSALEWAAFDDSALVPKTYIGAAEGVASLDSTGKLPTGQLPVIYSTDTMPFAIDGSVTDGTYLVQRIFRNKVRIDGICAKLTSGSCSIQLSVDGSLKGSPVTVTSSINDVVFGTVYEVDAIASSRRIEIVVTSSSTPVDLEVGISFAAEGA